MVVTAFQKIRNNLKQILRMCKLSTRFYHRPVPFSNQGIYHKSVFQDYKKFLGEQEVLEKLKWKDPATTDDWKLENIEECKNRLTPIQLDYWQKSYEFKLEHGTSMHKYGKTVRNEI